MRFAIVDESVVTNVVLADAETGAARGWIAAGEDVAAGWTFDGETFSAPPAPSAEQLRALIAPVSPRQAKLALLAADLLDDAEAALDALPDPQRKAARIEWEYAQDFRRDHPLIVAIGAALSLTEEQIDDLFAAAAGL